MNKVIKSFKKQGITISPAGRWKFDSEGRKEAVDANRKDGESWEDHPSDNMAKYRPELSGHYVLDIDDMKAAKKVLPKKLWKYAMSTFRYNTSSDNKIHCLFKRSGDQKFKRVIWKNGAVDSLPDGVLFTGHLIDDENSKFKLYPDPVLEISDAEIQKIVDIIIENAPASDREGMKAGGMETVLLKKKKFKYAKDLEPGEKCDCPVGEKHSDGAGIGYAFKNDVGGVTCNGCGVNYHWKTDKERWTMDLGGTKLSPSEDDSEADEDVAVKKRIRDAQEQGVVAYDAERKQIKADTGLSLSAVDALAKEVKREKVERIGASKYFEGDIVWDPSMGVFCEVNEGWLEMYSKTNFPQTFVGASGVYDKDLIPMLMATIPNVYVLYRPDAREGKMTTHNGKPAVNVYRGVRFKGKGKKLPKLYSKALDNLFKSEPAAKEVFINWMAYILQTGKRTGVAWGFFGASGSGKGLVSDMMRSLVGFRNTSFNKSDTDLQSAFNPYAMHKMFIHLNEVASDFHGRHGVAGKLKALVSDTVLTINQKGIAEVEVENYANVIMNSNKPNPIELDADDRRWNMIVSEQSLTKCSWWYDGAYEDIMAEVSKLGSYLMAYDVDEDAATNIMAMNDAKAGIIAQTTSNVQQVCELINNGGDVVEFMELDPNNLLVDSVTLAQKTRKWSNEVLLSMYRLLVGSSERTVYEMNRSMKKPYLSGTSCAFKLEGRTYKGVTF